MELPRTSLNAFASAVNRIDNIKLVESVATEAIEGILERQGDERLERVTRPLQGEQQKYGTFIPISLSL